MGLSLVDSHCHLDLLDLKRLGTDLQGVVEEARRQGVERILCVCIELERFPRVLELARSLPGVRATVGVHPNVRQGRDPSVEELVALAADPAVVGIGETGLDYYRSQGDLGWQQERFRRHVRAALETGKPLVIHSREATEDTLRILREEGGGRVPGVLHCFTGDQAMAEACLELGLHISFSGILTFTNAEPLRQVARSIPADRLLVETDAPYLTPVPVRGRPNQPAHVRHVAERLAEVRGESLEEVAAATTANYRRLFLKEA
ncbi:MAG: TatD family deoxyribonuclease [Gammaproteobacteria bacterium]|nr:MAG: TatD family deoxyribonuclease [Gammaproteobacteria bacterium]